MRVCVCVCACVCSCQGGFVRAKPAVRRLAGQSPTQEKDREIRARAPQRGCAVSPRCRSSKRKLQSGGARWRPRGKGRGAAAFVGIPNKQTCNEQKRNLSKFVFSFKQKCVLPRFGPPLAEFGRYFGVRKLVSRATFWTNLGPWGPQKQPEKQNQKKTISKNL